MKINSIEGLRAILAWWVVACHALHLTGFVNPQNSLMMLILNAGYAVDIFIIISGFVIFYLIDRRKEPYNTYFIRRLFRIYPLFIISVILGILTMNLRLSNIEISNGLLFEQNIWIEKMILHSHNVAKYLVPIVFMLHGCVPQSIMPYASTAFNGPIWSISLEMQFYMVAPLIFSLLTSSKTRLLTSILLIFAGIFSGLFVRTELGSFFTEHLNWFILGWISYFLYTFLENHPDTLKRIPISIGFTLIACIGLYFSNEINEFIRPKGDPKLPAFLPFLAWLVFFGFIIDSLKDSTSKASSIFRWFFENRFLIHLGKNSYSTYLLHVPILSVVVHMILINNFCSDRWHLFVVTLSISIPVIMIISHLAYIYIENPCIRVGSKIAKKMAKF